MMRDYATILKRLRQYSENCVAYKLDADFANAVTDAADAIEELLGVRMINLTEKCGSCEFFKPNFPTASGWCKARKYGDDVVHDPENPYPYVARSRLKCKLYKPPTEPPKGVE